MKAFLRTWAAAICGLWMWQAPAAAENLFVEYYALIADVDLVNSSGAPLGNTCAILQQDRANVHRFNLGHSGDRPDPVFGNKEMRARLGTLCRASGGFPFVMNTIAQYGSIYVWVLIYQEQGQLTRMVVRNGAG